MKECIEQIIKIIKIIVRKKKSRIEKYEDAHDVLLKNKREKI